MVKPGSRPTTYLGTLGMKYWLRSDKLNTPKLQLQPEKIYNPVPRMDNPEHGITVTDPMTGQDVVLSEKDIDAIRRIRSGKVPDSGYNLYEDWIEWFRCRCC